MEIKQELEGDVYILSPIPSEGAAGKTENILAVRNDVTRLVGEGARKLVIDLARVDFMNSTEIGALVGAVRTMQPKNGVLIITGLGLRLAETLAIVRMFQILPVRITRQEAVVELRRVKPDRNTMQMLAGNPGMDQIRMWWDSKIKRQTGEIELPKPAQASQESKAPEEEEVTVEEVRSETSSSMLSAETALPIERPIPPAFRGDVHDWVEALQIVRDTRRLCAKHGVKFSSDMSFKTFLSALADGLIDKEQ